jgi:phosphopantothenoylcysteine decarboxylase/phosphopantothenate--cysteine ligase
MAAAVADFRPAAPLAEKIDKSLGPPPPIELEPTEDVLCGLAARRRPGQVLVGFAAEHGDRAVARGLQKLERKGLDLVVVNDVSKPGVGFESAHNEVTILAADGANRHVPQAGKDQVACAILDEVDRIRASMVNRDGAGGAGARSPARV